MGLPILIAAHDEGLFKPKRPSAEAMLLRTQVEVPQISDPFWGVLIKRMMVYRNVGVPQLWKPLCGGWAGFCVITQAVQIVSGSAHEPAGV